MTTEWMGVIVTYGITVLLAISLGKFLFVTVLSADVAEAIAEVRSKVQAESLLKKTPTACFV
ncbi:hypothetical protein [Spirosoma aerolatum]|uniref:hypothetical protein n=1 Tax=Spirosoma aerolatum TaxID=1211326 RepID=UPI0009AE2521|nr:hypothetical protein [Spirosoma aerolatum]